MPIAPLGQAPPLSVVKLPGLVSVLLDGLLVLGGGVLVGGGIVGDVGDVEVVVGTDEDGVVDEGVLVAGGTEVKVCVPEMMTEVVA